LNISICKRKQTFVYRPSFTLTLMGITQSEILSPDPLHMKMMMYDSVRNNIGCKGTSEQTSGIISLT